MSRKMKDSGVEWIGEIPSEWKTIKFKYLHDGLNTGEAIDKEYWTENENDKVFYTAGFVPLRTQYADFPEWKYTKTTDLLLARNGTPYVFLPVEDACYTDHVIRACLKVGINRDFVQYGLQRSIMSTVVDTVSIATWSASLWNEQMIAWPSDAEQMRIASYLDQKVAQIDAIIEKTRASIEEYKKLKQAIITQAVTKGVRGERKMKDSGIEWIGEIPEEWEVLRGKQLFYEVNERTITGEEELLTVSQYTGITPRSQKKVTMFEAETLEGYKICHAGDIVANTMWLWAGAIGVSEYDGVISPSYNVYRQKSEAYINGFLDLLLRNESLVQNYASHSTGIRASRLRLYPHQFLNIFFLMPSVVEQYEIMDYLRKRLKQMDMLIERKLVFLTELESYKKSLIYEYVTGKKEVPA